jgi:predicted signal transduction protein with EAL and GGDEF domain
VHLPDRPPVRLSVSVGVAAYPEDTDSASDLFGLADEALYEAKRLGRDRTCTAAAVRGGSSSRAVPSLRHDAQVTRSESNAGTGHRRPSQ